MESRTDSSSPQYHAFSSPQDPFNENIFLDDEGDTDGDSRRSSESAPNSLFDDLEAAIPESVHGFSSLPPVPGLIYDPQIQLDPELCAHAAEYCMNTYFGSSHVNQIMLFERAGSDTGLPPPLARILDMTSTILRNTLSNDVHRLLFESSPLRASRQAILNLYHPGEGITPHVDLLRRFGDGIVGVTLKGSCVMDLCKNNTSHGVYLPDRSIIAFTGEARYDWTHGIERRVSDYVEDLDGGRRWVDRGVRLSVTFRWMLPGADVVGDSVVEA